MRAQVVRLPVEEAKGLRFHRLSTADGLSQTRVAQIVQDDLGFVWFGTQYGLNRYDGYNFKLFVHEPGNAELGGRHVRLLAVQGSRRPDLDRLEQRPRSPRSANGNLHALPCRAR